MKCKACLDSLVSLQMVAQASIATESSSFVLELKFVCRNTGGNNVTHYFTRHIVKVQ
jgi:hypothetical protein